LSVVKYFPLLCARTADNAIKGFINGEFLIKIVGSSFNAIGAMLVLEKSFESPANLIYAISSGVAK